MTRPAVSMRTLAYIRRRVLMAMTAEITILRMVRPDLDGNSLLVTSGVASTIYTGNARIRNVGSGGPIIVGEETVSTSNTLISIPFDAVVPRIDDVVLVGDYGPEDTDLNDRAFQIKDVDGGGLLRAVRTLSCSKYEESRWWER